MGPPPPDPHSGSDPERLEARMEVLAQSVQRLEARVAALEGLPAPLASAPERPAAVSLPGPLPSELGGFSPIAFLGQLGKACLILAGAFLIRTFTESGALPKVAGVALGFLYAAVWAVFAERGGRKGTAQWNALLTLTVALIAYPLLWEATTRLEVLPPAGAAAALLAVTAGLMAVAWRCDLEGVAWTLTVASVGTGLGLLMFTSSVEAFTAALLLLGLGSLWLTYGHRWHGLRWPAALAADAAVVVLTVLAAWPGGPPVAYRGLTPRPAIVLAVALVLVYLGSFVGRILRRRRDVSAFEVVQTILVLLAGFGGAVRVAQATGSGGALLGSSALVVGLACYGVAFAFVEKQSAGGRNFVFFTSLALVLAFAGSALLLGGSALAAAWTVAGLLAAMLGVRFERYSLLAHGAAYLSAAALVSGLLQDSLQAFLGPLGPPRPLLGFLGALLLLGLAAGHVLLSSQRSRGGLGWVYRLPAFLLGVQALLVLGALVISLLLTGATPPDGGTLAALRTGVLSVSAIALAAVARKFPASELGWLVYPLLGATALKLLMEDVAKGRPLTLTLAFTLFGGALLVAPRLLRAREAPAQEGG